MLGLLGIGAALMLGVFMNLAAGAGALLLLLMWTAVLPPENNPFMDDHIIYALPAGCRRTWGGSLPPSARRRASACMTAPAAGGATPLTRLRTPRRSLLICTHCCIA